MTLIGKSCLIRSLTVKRVADTFPPCFFHRAVAQTGSAFAWGAKGQEFKSPRPDHFKPEKPAYFLGNKRVFAFSAVSVQIWDRVCFGGQKHPQTHPQTHPQNCRA